MITPRIRRSFDSSVSSADDSIASCRASTWSSERVSRVSTLSTPASLVAWFGCTFASTGLRDSSRASRSGGAVKITVSLIGDGFGVAGAADGSIAGPRAGGRIAPVTSGMLPSAVARPSSAVWRFRIWSSFWSNCSWSSN